MEGEELRGWGAVVLNGEGGGESFPVPSRPTLSFALSCKVQVRPLYAFVCVCFSPLVYIYCNYRGFITYHER